MYYPLYRDPLYYLDTIYIMDIIVKPVMSYFLLHSFLLLPIFCHPRNIYIQHVLNVSKKKMDNACT